MTIKSISGTMAIKSISIILADSFAKNWYEDALNESKSTIGNKADRIRREIVFATCFAESYIFEWTRNKLPSMTDVGKYFPVNPRYNRDKRFRRRVEDKWEQVPAELLADNGITHRPLLNLKPLKTLVKYRNGLLHAASSRPETEATRAHHRPFPTKHRLGQLPSGWAVQIVTKLVKKLSSDLNESLPPYIP